MKKLVLVIGMVATFASASFAQQASVEDQMRQLVPYAQLKQEVPGLTPAAYEAAISEAARQYLGSLSANRYDANSTSNPYGSYGSPYSPTSINNPNSPYGSPYSPNSAANPYSTSGPSIYGRDGQYLGHLNANPYDPESVSNPYGLY